MKKIFQSLPSPVQKQAILRVGGGLLFMILFIIMLIMSRDFTMSLPALVVAIFLFINVGVILYTFLKGKYISVEGTCLRLDTTEIRKRAKTLYIAVEEGVVKIQLKQKTPKTEIGNRIIVYLSEKAPVYEKDDMLILNNYYAIEIRKDI